jgi:hypothetical protein
MSRRKEDQVAVEEMLAEVVGAEVTPADEIVVDVIEGEDKPVLVEDATAENILVEAVEPEVAEAVLESIDAPFIDIKLTIHEIRPIAIPEGTKIVIENLGGGDLYVGNEVISYAPDSLIAVGDRKEFVGGETIILTSASRPTFRVYHIE